MSHSKHALNTVTHRTLCHTANTSKDTVTNRTLCHRANTQQTQSPTGHSVPQSKHVKSLTWLPHSLTQQSSFTNTHSPIQGEKAHRQEDKARWTEEVEKSSQNKPGCHVPTCAKPAGEVKKSSQNNQAAMFLHCHVPTCVKPTVEKSSQNKLGAMFLHL